MKDNKRFANIVIPASVVLGNFCLGIMLAEVLSAVLA